MEQRALPVVVQDPGFGGGALAHIHAFANGAQTLGRSPHLYFVSRNAHSPTAMEGVPATRLRALTPQLDVLDRALAGQRIARLLSSAPTIWSVGSVATYGLAALRSGRPYACWVGTSVEADAAPRIRHLPVSRRLAFALNRPGLERIERHVLQGAHAVYATSPNSAREVAAAGGMPTESIRILPLPIDLDRFSPESDEKWLETLRAPKLLFVGRGDDPRKNLPLLLNAFAAIRAEVPQATLRIVGAHPPPEVRRLAGHGVTFDGFAEDLAAEYRSATLFVLPSRQEGFGIVAAEALASGLPVIATPSGGPEELVRNAGGWVLKTFEPKELTQTIVAALTEDPPLLLQRRERGRAHVVGEHSYERFLPVLADALAELDRLAV